MNVTHVGSVTWSRDSKYVFCDQEGPERWARRVRIADGATERLADLSGRQAASGAGLALDGSPLYLLVSFDVYTLELANQLAHTAGSSNTITGRWDGPFGPSLGSGGQ